MRSIKPIALGIATLCCILSSVCVAYADADPTAIEQALKDMELVAENDSLCLSIDMSTTAIAVLDKRTGLAWFSNPPNIDTHEKLAKGQTKLLLSSQLMVNYYDVYGFKTGTVQLDNYTNSVQFYRSEVSKIENGVRIDYTIGQKWRSEDFLPKLIDEQRYLNELMSAVPSSEKSDFEKYYVPVSLAKAGGPVSDLGLEVRGLDENRLSAILDGYDIIPLDKSFHDDLAKLSSMQQELAMLQSQTEQTDESQSRISRLQLDVKKLSDDLKKRKRDVAESILNTILQDRYYETVSEVTKADLDPLRDRTIYYLNAPPRFARDRMANALRANGYTPDDVGPVHEELGLSAPIPNAVVFEVPLEYLLDGENLLVRVPLEEVKYPQDVFDPQRSTSRSEKVSYPIESIRVLEYFGAADSTHSGYVLVPDGSGALIEFGKQGKESVSSYKAQVYGVDPAQASAERLAVTEVVRLPVLGLIYEDRALLAIIEEGEALATVYCDTAGLYHSYNAVYAEFKFLPSQRISGTGSDDAFRGGAGPLRHLVSPRPYQGSIVIRYTFLGEEEASYVGMAQYYQEYLKERYRMDKLEPDSGYPFVLELIGGVRANNRVMGVPVRSIEPLTSFEEALEILKDLSSGGVESLYVKYRGWLRGGIDHDYPSKASPEPKLGSERSLLSLIDYANQSGAHLYPTVAFQNVYHNRLFTGFRPWRDASRDLSQQIIPGYRYNAVTFEKEPVDNSYLLSPSRLASLVDSYLKSYSRYGLKAISLQDMGTQVHSDLRTRPESEHVDRQQALKIVRDQLAKIVEAGYSVMIDGGDSYALPYADCVVNMPTSSSEYDLLEESVPFIQIVSHGYAVCAGPPINLAGDFKEAMLKAVETGSALHYRWAYRGVPPDRAIETSGLFSIEDSRWLGPALEFYERVNDAIGAVAHLEIVGHEKLSGGVYRTTYEDGRSVIVNYNDHPVVVDGVQVNAEDFVVLGEGVLDGYR